MVFKITEETIKERKRLIYIIMISFIVGLLIIIKISGVNIFQFRILKSLFKIITMLIIETVIVNKILFKKLRKMEIVINDDEVRRHGGKFAEVIKFENLNKVKIERKPSGNIVRIKLNDTGANFNLSGFENMEEISNSIIEKLNNKSIIKNKVWKLNWQNPIVILVEMIVLFGLAGLLMKYKSAIYEHLMLINAIGLGGYTIWKKPISRSLNKGFRVVEIVIGGIMIAYAIKNIVS